MTGTRKSHGLQMARPCSSDATVATAQTLPSPSRQAETNTPVRGWELGAVPGWALSPLGRRGLSTGRGGPGEAAGSSQGDRNQGPGPPAQRPFLGLQAGVGVPLSMASPLPPVAPASSGAAKAFVGEPWGREAPVGSFIGPEAWPCQPLAAAGLSFLGVPAGPHLLPLPAPQPCRFLEPWSFGPSPG